MVKAIVTGVSSKMGGRLVQFVMKRTASSSWRRRFEGSSAIGQDVGEYHTKVSSACPLPKTCETAST
jgi:hypothetical protein